MCVWRGGWRGEDGNWVGICVRGWGLSVVGVHVDVWVDVACEYRML